MHSFFRNTITTNTIVLITMEPVSFVTFYNLCCVFLLSVDLNVFADDLPQSSIIII